MRTSKRPTVITPNILRRMPLPLPFEGGDHRSWAAASGHAGESD